MDMSKAFDNIKRKDLIDDLSLVLEQDELHLFKVLLQVELIVRCGEAEGDFFATDTGAPQGDCMNATEFTFYLAKTLESENENIGFQGASYKGPFQKDTSTKSSHSLVK